MKIGILQTAYKKSSEYGSYYNVQELGLGRALAKAGHCVTLYKGVDGESSERVECNGNLRIKLIGLKYWGINGLIDPDILDTSLDMLIYFCDTQLKVPSVYSWCKRNGIPLYPYIGVIESHSENLIKRILMKIATTRNISVYKKCSVFAKTPIIQDKLVSLGCKNVTLVPVGLDVTVMKHDVQRADFDSNVHSCVDSLLFIGRMEEEKQPFEMLYIYKELLKHKSDLKLTMIGDGYLYEAIEDAINKMIAEMNLSKGQIKLIRKVKYEDIANYYLSSSCYINLNRVEILGMSLLEAMYYKCPIFAINAPGPNFILNGENNQKYGIIADNYDSLISEMIPYIIDANAVTNLYTLTNDANMHVKNNFIWDSIIQKFFA